MRLRGTLRCIAVGMIFTLPQLHAQPGNTVLVIDGYSGEAPVADLNGKPFVDVHALAQITNGSVTREPHRIVLSLHGPTAGDAHNRDDFSQPFMRAGIESVATMREWASALVVAMENGYPVGESINPYRARAADAVRLASAAASTEADRSGAELLNREFSGVESWSSKLVNARNSLSGANYAMSDDAIRGDSQFQNLVKCGQSLGAMFASGKFHDDGSCRF